jgi:hypothetical protein
VKLHSIILSLTGLLLVQSAAAETHIFLIDSFDGYGVDRCLASGESCGRAAATALCRHREYSNAVDYGRIDTSEITGGMPSGTSVKACDGHSCPEIVAITCSR